VTWTRSSDGSINCSRPNNNSCCAYNSASAGICCRWPNARTCSSPRNTRRSSKTSKRYGYIRGVARGATGPCNVVSFRPERSRVRTYERALYEFVGSAIKLGQWVLPDNTYVRTSNLVNDRVSTAGGPSSGFRLRPSVKTALRSVAARNNISTTTAYVTDARRFFFTVPTYATT